MAIRFHVEDQLHRRDRSFSDDRENSFLALARRLTSEGSRVFDIVDPYADAMLNFIQIDRLIDELADALWGDMGQDERDMAVKVQGAAREARGLSGYLFLEGD